jgi:hypothetical protein
MKSVFLAAVLAAVLCISGNLWAGSYSGGSGTQADPYKISTVADLQWLMIHNTDWDKHFILTGSLDLAGIPVTPIGTQSTQFTGVFDGQDYTISRAVINQTGVSNVGLFGYVFGGQISNLGLPDITVTGQNNVGGLVGLNKGGSIQFCYATGSVSGLTGVGGLVGGNREDGSNFGTITACYFRGQVNGTTMVGGLAGFNYIGGTIADSYASAQVIGTNLYIGGLVGKNEGSITSCYAAGETQGSSSVGGLVGGLANGGAVNSCYAASVVSGTGSNVGGLIGSIDQQSSVAVSFWDMQISRQETSTGGEGKTTLEMQSDELYIHEGWDFLGETDNGTDDIWMMPAVVGYPIFSWTERPGNDLMAHATLLPVEAAQEGTSIGATGQDITLNGYNDWADVWYYYDCTANDKFTITLNSPDFDTTLAVFDAKGREIVFNDDFFGGKSVVILKARTEVRYYIRVSGYDGLRGEFEIFLERGAVQAIQGDLNYDGHVNLIDFAIFADNWLGGM